MSGINGINGLDGLSAYEIAVSRGFTGTEADWLASLKGEPGAAGDDGASVDPDTVRAMVAEAVAQLPPPPPGPKGERGPKGEPGAPAAGTSIADGPEVRPWAATFARDKQTRLATRVLYGPAAEAPVIELLPDRDEAGLISRVIVRPYEGALP